MRLAFILVVCLSFGSSLARAQMQSSDSKLNSSALNKASLDEQAGRSGKTLQSIISSLNEVGSDRDYLLQKKSLAGEMQDALHNACRLGQSKRVTLHRGIYIASQSIEIPANCDGLTIDLNKSKISLGQRVDGKAAAFFVGPLVDNTTIENGTIDGKDMGTSFFGYISGDVLTVTSVTMGKIYPGMRVFAAGGVPGTLIINGSGNSWIVNKSQAVGELSAPIQMVAGNSRPIIGVEAPVRGLKLKNITFQNDAYTLAGVGFTSEDTLFQLGSLTTNLSAPVIGNSGERMFSLREVPPALHVGAYFAGTNMRPEYYVTSIDRATKKIGISIPISDSYRTGQPLSFTPAASLTVNADAGVAVLRIDTRNGLASGENGIHVGQTAWSPTDCIPEDDRVISADAETRTVVLERPLTCKVPAGSSIAFASGVSHVTLSHLKFLSLGQAGRYQAKSEYRTVAEMPSDRSMVFPCTYSSCDGKVGLQPGDMSSSVAQGGLMADDMIIKRVINHPKDGQYTVILGAPVARDVPKGTSLSWQTSGFAGVGYGWYLAGYGVWFSNVFWREESNYYHNVFSTSFFGQALSRAVFLDDICDLGFHETTSVDQAGGGCGGIASSKDVAIKNMSIKNAVGTGITIQRDSNVSWMGGVSEYNGNEGLIACDVHRFEIGGGFVARNNGQAANAQLAQTPYESHGFYAAGIDISGSCGGSKNGVSTGVSIGDVEVYDDQLDPTQYYGLTELSKNGSPVYGSISLKAHDNGSVGGSIDPRLMKSFKTGN